MSSCTLVDLNEHRYCEGAYELYCSQIEIAEDNAAPDADRAEMRRIKRAFREAQSRFNHRELQDFVIEMECAAKSMPWCGDSAVTP